MKPLDFDVKAINQNAIARKKIGKLCESISNIVTEAQLTKFQIQTLFQNIEKQAGKTVLGSIVDSLKFGFSNLGGPVPNYEQELKNQLTLINRSAVDPKLKYKVKEWLESVEDIVKDDPDLQDLVLGTLAGIVTVASNKYSLPMADFIFNTANQSLSKPKETVKNKSVEMVEKWASNEFDPVTYQYVPKGDLLDVYSRKNKMPVDQLKVPSGLESLGIKTAQDLLDYAMSVSGKSLEESVQGNLSKSQVAYIFGSAAEKMIIREGIFDAIKQKTKSLTNKVTTEKLLKAWEQAGSPLDSSELAELMTKLGVPQNVIGSVYKQMSLPFTPRQASAPSQGQQKVEPYMGAEPTPAVSDTMAEPLSHTIQQPKAQQTATKSQEMQPKATTPSLIAPSRLSGFGQQTPEPGKMTYNVPTGVSIPKTGAKQPEMPAAAPQQTPASQQAPATPAAQPSIPQKSIDTKRLRRAIQRLRVDQLEGLVTFMQKDIARSSATQAKESFEPFFVSEASDEDMTRYMPAYTEWAKRIIKSHPTYASRIEFIYYDDIDSVVAEIPSMDRAFGIFSLQDMQGDVLYEGQIYSGGGMQTGMRWYEPRTVPNQNELVEADHTFAGKDPMSFTSPKGGKPQMLIVTDQGSRYLITDDGMVLRHKSFHANTGGADQGLQNWHDAIEFYAPEDLGGTTFPLAVSMAVEKRLPVALSKAGPNKKALVINKNGQWGVAKLSDVFKNVAKDDMPIVGTFTKTPKLGYNVLDYNMTGNGALKSAHAGSPVSHGVKLSEDEALESAIMKGIVDENLRKWFKEKWVRFNPQGKIMGPCARGSDKEGKPKCLPQAKAHALGKKGRKYAAAKKRREDPNPERSGPAKNVATKKKSNEGVSESSGVTPTGYTWSFEHGREVPWKSGVEVNTFIRVRDNKGKTVLGVWADVHGDDIEIQYSEIVDEKLRGKGIYTDFLKGLAKHYNIISDQDQNNAAKSIYKKLGADYNSKTEKHILRRSNQDVAEAELDEACWKGYHKEGMKTMFGKKYPNCVKNTNEDQAPMFTPESKCPHCGGELVSESQLNEKKDACYYKVKSRYKVWPSAYASGALVQCRKKGASNWGTKSESVTEEDEDKVIRLRNDGKEKANAFIDKVYSLYPNTFQNNHVMVWGEGDEQQIALFELIPSLTKRGAVEVKWFQAYPLRQGIGSRAMQELQRLAREDGISLTLYPWDKGRVSRANLIKFYKKFGFKPSSKGAIGLQWDPEMNEGDDEEHYTGGGLGTPYPGTYEQETLPYRTKGQKRTQSIAFEDENLEEKWSEKYKRSIDCSNPKGFSQRAHCQGRKKKD